MLSKKDFKCNRCGACCIDYIVKLTGSDIKRIKKKRSGFFTFDRDINAPVLKRRKDGRCIFLTGNGFEYSCSIYDIRPKVCEKYPFVGGKVESCKPVTLASAYARKV